MKLQIINGPNLNLLGQREPYRRQSMIAPACLGVVCGFGLDSYRLAVEALTKK